MSRWSLVLLGALLAMTTAACDLLQGARDALDIDRSTWRLVSIDGQPPLAGTEPTITFEAGQVSGTTGCNSFFGSYQVNGSNISVGVLGSTAMACEPPLSEQEARIIERVGAAEAIELADGELQLVGPAGSLGSVPAG
jgi:heat shock protein HslJ